MFKQCAASQVAACLEMLPFSLDTGPESLPPLMYCLSTMGCLKSAQNSTSQLSQVTYWFLVQALLHPASSLIGYSMS